MKRRRDWSKKQKIRAVHDDDLEGFLDSLDLLQNLKRGELRCTICGVQVTLDNFGAVGSHNGTIILACDRTSCLAELESGDRCLDD